VEPVVIRIAVVLDVLLGTTRVVAGQMKALKFQSNSQTALLFSIAWHLEILYT
jgi:hypothetical protein